ncbi:MAG: sigma-54-dependent Fis family transcriptional regulator [Bacillota bacterium]
MASSKRFLSLIPWVGQPKKVRGNVMAEFSGVHKQVWKAWKSFIASQGNCSHILRPEILTSWERCRERGIDPYQDKGRDLLEGRAFQEARQRHEELLRAARPVMEKLLTYCADLGFLAVLVDEDGYILESLGTSPETIEMAKKVNFVPGACWREDKVGTNGIGTAWVLGKALEVTGAEHFCSELHWWTCSGSPIFGSDGRPVGVIDLSGPWYVADRKALATTVVAATAIENSLKRGRSEVETIRYRDLARSLLHRSNEPQVVVDLTGKVLVANCACEKILGWTPKALAGLVVTDLLEDNHSLLSVAASRKSERQDEVNVQARNGLIRCSAEFSPVTGDSNECIGVLVTLKLPARRQFQLTGTPTAFRGFEPILGTHPRLRESVRLAQIAATSDAPVLLSGETGTGKELFARAIHEASGRKGPFIAVNCGALPRELVGSELFGYTGGAFTGARPDGRAGKFEQANGGTLFLDEISEMPLDMQVYLLRALEEKKIVRLGGAKEVPVDTRVIAATNCDLEKLVSEKKFRQDLYYRLAVLTIHLCPLRERKSDIPLLFQTFLTEAASKLGKDSPVIDSAVWPLLEAHDWPGNVRELRNVAEWAAHMLEGTTLLPVHLPSYLVQKTITARDLASTEREMNLRELERHEIQRLLAAYGGNVTKAARALGIARNTLYRKLYKYGLRVRHCSKI